MKKLILSILIATPVFADCGIEPIEPIPPIGCRILIPQCICDDNGNCHWQWLCEAE